MTSKPTYIRMALVVVAVVFPMISSQAKEFDQTAICDAIKNEWKVLLVYRQSESAESPREVVPRFLGRTKDDKVVLNGLQIGGFSESGNLPGHRSFRLDRTSNITFTKDRVPTGPGGGRSPSGVVDLICGR